jgi:hypothetical protein
MNTDYNQPLISNPDPCTDNNMPNSYNNSSPYIPNDNP